MSQSDSQECRHACPKDVPSIQELINRFADQEEMLPRTLNELYENMRDFTVCEIDGKLVTPPVSSGALPGTLREDLIARGQCEERVLSLSELRAARRMFVGNSVHGLVAVDPDFAGSLGDSS